MRQDDKTKDRTEMLERARDPQEREQLSAAISALEEAALSWCDEPPAPWRLQSSRRRFAAVWTTWAPLAACLIMTVAVAFRVEITSDATGFRVSFGSSEPALTREVVEAQMARNRIETTEMVSAVLNEYRHDQDQYLEEVVVRLGEHQRQQRGEDIKTLMSAWQVQRQEDLDVMEQRFQTIFVRQQLQASDLYSLASYVNQSVDPDSRL